MEKISIDLETFSNADISECGAYRYVDDDSFQVLLFAYSVDEGPVDVVDLAHGEQIPESVLLALTDETVAKWAYNASFERVCLSKMLGYPAGQYLSPRGWYCSMVWGEYLGMPGGLARVGEILGLGEDKKKLDFGKKLIRKFCCLQKDGTRVWPDAEPLDWELFVEYNRRDVETELEIKRILADNPVPRSVWEEYWIDQSINDNGVLIDTVLVDSAVAIDSAISAELTERLRLLTGLGNPNSVSQLMQWLTDNGCDLISLGKKEVEKYISECSDARVKEVLQLRQLSAKSSVKKYQAMQRALCSDGRVRGMFQFYGATRTGRWAGRLVQMQNLPQNHVEPLADIRRLVKRRDTASLDMCFDSVPEVLSELIRTAFIARPGTRFIVADFSAIEARVIAWLAGEEWRQKVFAEGGDIYCASASQMFHVPVVKHGVNGHLRQKGKIAELALGYGGSVGALKAMGALDMGVKEEELQSLVDAWRGANPMITRLWWDVDRCVKSAILERTSTDTHGIRFSTQGGTEALFIELPSGRCLTYREPRVENGQVTYMGVSMAKGWTRLESYGPKFVENIVQAIARDLLCNAMKKLQDYRIEMHIHDELVIEADEELSLDYVCNAMAQIPVWAKGLLLRADGYETPFYRKD